MPSGSSPLPIAGAPPLMLSPLGAALRDSGGPPPVDHARVAALRDAIASGHYRPDPGAIARALVFDTGPSASADADAGR